MPRLHSNHSNEIFFTLFAAASLLGMIALLMNDKFFQHNSPISTPKHTALYDSYGSVVLGTMVCVTPLWFLSAMMEKLNLIDLPQLRRKLNDLGDASVTTVTAFSGAIVGASLRTASGCPPVQSANQLAHSLFNGLILTGGIATVLSAMRWTLQRGNSQD